MEEKNLKKLMNRITVRRYVNLHADGNPLELGTIDDLIKRIAEMDSPKYSIAINIKSMPGNDEREEAGYLKEIINEEMAKKRFPHWIHEADAIDSLLHHLNGLLEDPALLIFYQFTSPDDEKEKNLLRSIRKFIQMRESLFLGLLLISSQKLYKWNILPMTDLDERIVEFFPYHNIKY